MLLGAARPVADDPVPDGTRSILLLGPGPDFWDVLTGSPEYRDGMADPVDRWSRRTVTGLAQRHGGTPLFPFGGPPWLPFIRWAQDSGRTHLSPVGLLVHAETGLFVSFRGAVALPGAGPDLPPLPRPCDRCATQPCRTACPVGALGGGTYDLPRCHAFLDTPDGTPCLSRGCAVRRACPVGAGLRPEAQSAHHMAAFHPKGEGG
ncbi:ferredoxin [Rhodobacteraceae bacterium KN286]|uniref:Ferredoxin n=2 Tax=Oceanomicrobium pacificus TaxID=2692916 RepID=A0A6B0TUF4_9RHOB|nr:ferredoxin [Oceanomicrobium pacificus]